MKKKIKIGFVVLVFIVVSVCGVSVYRHFTAPKKESVPLETVIRNSSDLITQKMQYTACMITLQMEEKLWQSLSKKRKNPLVLW